MKAPSAKVLTLILLAGLTANLRAADTAVVMSSDAEVYQETLEGFRDVARHRIVGV